MHASDILYYGHTFIERAVDGLDLEDPSWNISGACGIWSIREIIAHLTSFELTLVEILQLLLGEEVPTSLLAQMANPAKFNDDQVALRKNQTTAETWNEYVAAFQKSSELFSRIPVDQHRQSGLLEWYGPDYDLEDFLVYTFYGHKREHGAQINAFRDILDQQS